MNSADLHGLRTMLVEAASYRQGFCVAGKFESHKTVVGSFPTDVALISPVPIDCTGLNKHHAIMFPKASSLCKW